MAEEKIKARAAGELVSDKDIFDSNCITPGTVFMAEISKHLQYFIRKKMRQDPAWQRLTIIFSGHDVRMPPRLAASLVSPSPAARSPVLVCSRQVPGEGEHKIMDYIRSQKAQAGYNPNTRHCMAGLDADLIMLALASHEPHFSLLREQIDFNAFRRSKTGTKSDMGAPCPR